MKKIIISFLLLLLTCGTALAQTAEESSGTPTYLQSVISTDDAQEIQKSIIFDASQSFLPNPDNEVKYEWDFGDGNKNQGMEVLHAYQEPGKYTVGLTIKDGGSSNTREMEIIAYRNLILLITDQSEAQERIEVLKEFAEKQGVYIKVIESFGSSTEFISEEVLTKKLNEESITIQKANQIAVWTKENAGLNALSRYIQNNQKKIGTNFTQKTITILENNTSKNLSRIQRQFHFINPKSIIVAKEAAVYPLIDSLNQKSFIESLENGGYEYEVVTSKTGKLRPWNFMSYFVNFLINKGIPDNTIALLLLLPVIATVVAFTKQVIGITTFGIYTPSIITISFLIIGMYAGLLTLLTAISMGAIMHPVLKKVRMLFIPKMAIVITVVSLVLFLLLIASTYLGLFDTQFLSIAIFPMVILITLVEKFVSVKTEKGLSSAAILMFSTVLVSIISYFIVGGEVSIGIATLKFDFVKNSMIAYPELIFLILIINIILGKWSGLRILERIRFREVLRHIEE